MSCVHVRSAAVPFEGAAAATIMAQARPGFGVLFDIDVQAMLRRRIGKEIRPYWILGACSSTMDDRARKAEPPIGTLHPCNVVVGERDDGAVEIADEVRALLLRTANKPAG
jgi:uncharacterized protein (DUF302 family)